MRLFTILIAFISFSCLAQGDIIYEFASYQNKEVTENYEPIVKVQHYWKIYSNGKLEAIDENGKCTEHMLDVAILKQLNASTKKGLEKFRNQTEPLPDHFYAGHYSFLKKGTETVCFNPYDVDKKLKKTLENIEKSIEKGKNHTVSKCTLPENMSELIQKTHSKSNLEPNADPPPQM